MWKKSVAKGEPTDWIGGIFKEERWRSIAQLTMDGI